MIILAGTRVAKKAGLTNFPRIQPPNLLLIFSRIMESENHYNHHDTPTKAKVQRIIEFCERMNISYFKNDVFKTFEVSKQQGYQMLQPEIFARRRNNDSEHEETRGRKSLISDKDIREMERVLKSKDFEARALT